MSDAQRTTDQHLATRRLIIWSAKLADLWEPIDIAEFMLSPQLTFGSRRPIDMLCNQSEFEEFDGRMRALLDGAHT